MALTKKQLSAIQDIINKRMTSFTYEALGESALTSSEIESLKRAGLLRSSVRNFVGDSHTIGKVVALLPLEERVKLSFDQVKELAMKMKPMTDVERKALDYATEKAGVYIKGLRDDMIKRLTSEVARSGETALRKIQDGVKQAIVNRDTRSELASNLFNIIDNKTRDWQRVASTEMNNAVQNGIYRSIREASDAGAEQLVYKKPSPEACPHCLRIYLKEDGVTPKIFMLSQLTDTNIGLKARDWGPTIGTVHPFCQCNLMVVPEGYDFVKQNVAGELIEFGDLKFKKGQVIPDNIYDKFTEKDKSKTTVDAILSYTGKTGTPIKKSEMVFSDLEDELCNCDH